MESFRNIVLMNIKMKVYWHQLYLFLNLYYTITSFNDHEKYALEKIVGKVDNAGK